MPTTWQTQDHKAFINEHLSSYARSSMGKGDKSFWTSTFQLWFERWPLSDPPADAIDPEKTIEECRKAWEGKEIAVSIPRRRLALT